MIAKSLSPRRFHCFQLSLLACVALASTSFARPIFFAVDSTPYDRQMTRVQPILAAIDPQVTDEISVAVVNQWMNRVRRIPYRYSKQWQTPDEVSLRRAADCKGKAMFLYEIMRQMGATDVRLVIGRHRAGDWFTHAWLEWETASGSYVLDPTFSRRAVRMERQSPTRYIPLYAYEGELRYRAQNPSVPAENPPRAVAAGQQTWAMPSQGFTGLE